MRDFASCFGEHAVQVADYSSSSSSSKTHINGGEGGAAMMQNMVTCHYQTLLKGQPRLITVTWCKNLMGQGLSVNVDDPSCQSMCKVDMKSWFFWKKKGCKRLEVGANKVDVFWDLSCAKYGPTSPEPLEGYYVAVVSEEEVGLLLGDMPSEAYKRTHGRPCGEGSVLVSRKEHVFGKNFYTTKSQFSGGGKSHDIVIECQTGGPRDPRLCVKIDKQVVVQVKHLIWKFRGNQTILVDGLPVEMLWDVHDWFFNPSVGHAVFMFKTLSSSSASSSSSFSGEESWSSKSLTQSFRQLSSEESWSSKSMGSQSFKQRESSSSSSNGFSLVLYAWKNE